ncbi:right-handed parallel beta-helix repeat-containing protein [Desulfogranum japonicum]|uniref:right-handed parallel beta-helix repeat-containing protein n=1 Tax=Desulfogranum japonicum TaxID=231447 RepID=UPI000429C3AF|nr:right-handed parallel beta-helix repeat-containing protein [Desulfogranum japonicum]
MKERVNICLSLLCFVILSLSYSSCWAVTVASVTALENAVTAANSGGDTNIVIAAGTYNLNGVYLRITADNVTVAGATGKSADVILDGNYVTTEIFQIVSSNVTLKDMTLKRAYYHPIHIFPDTGDVTGNRILNVHIIDPGQQAIKINQDAGKNYSAVSGLISDSHIELTDSGRAKVWEINGSCYTGGVDGHHALNWTVSDNYIEGFWCENGLSEHGVHFWSSSADSLVEGNTIVNCDRGIGFGLGSSPHYRGIIRNNMLFHDSGHAHSDVGIGLENAQGAKVYNNTIYHQHSYTNAIEYRFSGTTGGTIANNLTNKAIASRDGGSAQVFSNFTSAQAAWFVNASSGNLHLAYAVNGVVDAGTSISGLTNDIDGQSRPAGLGVDIGADEYSSGDGDSPESVITPLMLLLKD